MFKTYLGAKYMLMEELMLFIEIQLVQLLLFVFNFGGFPPNLVNFIFGHIKH